MGAGGSSGVFASARLSASVHADASRYEYPRTERTFASFARIAATLMPVASTVIVAVIMRKRIMALLQKVKR